MEKSKSSKLQIVLVVLTAMILAIMITVGVFVISGVGQMQRTMTLIEKDLQEIDIDTLNETISSLNDAASSLGKLDMDSLNGLVSSLNTTSQVLAGISEGIGQLFGK